MADSFRVTGYNVNTDVATVTFILDPRTNFNGGTFAGVQLSGVPKDTVDNLKSHLRSYADAYISGKQAENARAASVSSEVAALLNVATGF